MLSWLWLCALWGVIVTEGKEHEEKRENLLIKNNTSTVSHSKEGELMSETSKGGEGHTDKV